MKLFRKIIAVGMAICFIVMGISHNVYATWEHVHKFIWKAYYGREYVAKNDSFHWVHDISQLVCFEESCGAIDWEIAVIGEEPHAFSGLTYTGTHYHLSKSKVHVAVYEKSCACCGYTEQVLHQYSCPGDGNCIAP